MIYNLYNNIQNTLTTIKRETSQIELMFKILNFILKPPNILMSRSEMDNWLCSQSDHAISSVTEILIIKVIRVIASIIIKLIQHL